MSDIAHLLPCNNLHKLLDLHLEDHLRFGDLGDLLKIFFFLRTETYRSEEALFNTFRLVLLIHRSTELIKY